MTVQRKIPVSAIVVTRDEERNIRRCLEALREFGEVIVVDSGSMDDTCAIAAECGDQVVNFEWDGAYPKKRQWCLDTLDLKHDWVFFVDADEVVTPDLLQEMRSIFASGAACAGYFVKGRYVWMGRVLRFGLCNNKLALLDRRKMKFPVVDDLDCRGMGEIEGHYQPVPREPARIGRIKAPLLHYAGDHREQWLERHARYAAWEIDMNEKDAWPQDVTPLRRALKRVFRALPGRPLAAFAHSYILRLGFLDGAAGFDFAKSRYLYYRMISDASKTPGRVRAGTRQHSAGL